MRLGLTGNIGTGKTVVGKQLAQFESCYVIEADRLGHEVMHSGGVAYARILEKFGPLCKSLLGPDQEIDRKALGSLVYEDAAQLGSADGAFHPASLMADLMRIVHPPVQELFDKFCLQIEASDPKALIFYEAALIFEAGISHLFSGIVLTTCPQALQLQRVMERDGFSEEEARRRISMQMPQAAKMFLADWTIDTSEPYDLSQLVRDILEKRDAA